tara:strand:- start:551 stop:943 length:393 start_codon:yes stop_codon:yes gene_type:complete
MIYILGIFIVSIGFIQLFRLYQNSKRPKVIAVIIDLVDTHIKQDKNKKFRTQPHAVVGYGLEGKKYKATVLFKDKSKIINDTVTLSYDLNNPNNVEMYVPKAELLMASAITFIGFMVLGISHYIMITFFY